MVSPLTRPLSNFIPSILLLVQTCTTSDLDGVGPPLLVDLDVEVSSRTQSTVTSGYHRLSALYHPTLRFTLGDAEERAGGPPSCWDAKASGKRLGL